MTWYTGDSIYDTVMFGALTLAALVAAAAWWIPSPYGRFSSERFGMRLNPRLGWFLMELPATVSFLIFYWQGPHRGDPVPLVFLVIWLVHYANRGFWFPLRIRTARGSQTSFSMTVVIMGWLVTGLHGYLNATYLTRLGRYSEDWLTDPRFLIGLAVYYASFVLNVQSDSIIRNLRTPDEVSNGIRNYRIPQGGLFRYVSSPQYLTELTAWSGFALCTWSLAGVFILAISMANLVPRALATQRWYLEKFPEYPKQRKAIVPFLL